MIIVSAGMQKSGSAYFYNILNDLLIASNYQDARLIKEKYKLDDVMQWHNNNVGDLDNKLLYRLLKISYREKRFAIKTHSGPTKLLKRLLYFKQAKTIYIYRDPRDVLLSVFDHGKKIISLGQNHTFAQMMEFDIAFKNVKNWTKIWKNYSEMNSVLSIKYEDLLAQPVEIIHKVSSYLNLKVSDQKIQEILLKFDKNNENAVMTGLHFNKGIAKRYETELTEEQKQKFKSELGETILAMGYEI